MKRFKTGKHYHNYLHPEKPRYASENRVAGKDSFNRKLKVVTYNIKLAQKTRLALDLLSTHHDLDNADIICLQEMDARGVKLIANNLHYNFVYYPAILHPRNNKDFGNAILSKWPIVSDKKIILPKLGAGKLQRIAVGATLLIDKEKVNVFCVHMKMYIPRHQRQIPIDKIINAVDPSVKYCIIAGDFNTFSNRNRKTILNSFKSADFRLATDSVGWTYSYWYLMNKKSTLDYIFTRGMSVLDTGKVLNHVPSDHIPVWGKLKLN